LGVNGFARGSGGVEETSGGREDDFADEAFRVIRQVGLDGRVVDVTFEQGDVRVAPDRDGDAGGFTPPRDAEEVTQAALEVVRGLAVADEIQCGGVTALLFGEPGKVSGDHGQGRAHARVAVSANVSPLEQADGHPVRSLPLRVVGEREDLDEQLKMGVGSGELHHVRHGLANGEVQRLDLAAMLHGTGNVQDEVEAGTTLHRRPANTGLENINLGNRGFEIRGH
jgi:hypothetical protein